MATVYCLDCMATIDNTDQLTFLNKTQDQHGIHLLTSCLCTNILSPMGVSRSEKDIDHGVKYLLANFNLPYDNKVLIPLLCYCPQCMCMFEQIMQECLQYSLSWIDGEWHVCFSIVCQVTHHHRHIWVVFNMSQTISKPFEQLTGPFFSLISICTSMSEVVSWSND